MATFENTKYPRISLRIPKELRDELDQLASSRNMSLAKLVKNLLVVGIAMQKEKGE